VSGLSTLVMSLICATSSLAATRGATFLPAAVAAKQDVAVVGWPGPAPGRRYVFGEGVFELRAVCVQHLCDAGDLGGGLGRFGSIRAGDQHVHVTAALRSGGHGVEGRRLRMDCCVVVFCVGIVITRTSRVPLQITFASVFSFCTSVATSGTFTPAPRLAVR
jgi:hypothetical protein